MAELRFRDPYSYGKDGCYAYNEEQGIRAAGRALLQDMCRARNPQSRGRRLFPPQHQERADKQEAHHTPRRRRESDGLGRSPASYSQRARQKGRASRSGEEFRVVFRTLKSGERAWLGEAPFGKPEAAGAAGEALFLRTKSGQAEDKMGEAANRGAAAASEGEPGFEEDFRFRLRLHLR